MKISANTVVTLDYEVKDPQHEMVDPGERPLVYLHGSSGIFPKLEAALDDVKFLLARPAADVQMFLSTPYGKMALDEARVRPLLERLTAAHAAALERLTRQAESGRAAIWRRARPIRHRTTTPTCPGMRRSRASTSPARR